MPRAEEDLDAIFVYIRGMTAPLAEAWFTGLLDAIASLETLPQRCPATHEDRSLRHLLYGKTPHIYRLIYSIDENRRRVEVLHVRHHARGAFQSQDLP